MSTPVLATKLFAPTRRTQFVARPRIAEHLDATLDAGHRLTLVSAPPGFGKTTLLSVNAPTREVLFSSSFVVVERRGTLGDEFRGVLGSN